ncbi:hypothetical protein P67b_00033 [Ruegeria phage Tedan]|nr:hypothetical protein P67b_00033 [Ruegeria phage Tedan]
MAINSFDGTYRFLSNFYPSPIRVAGIEYPTAEHAYQAMKTMGTKDRLTISRLPTPGQAKRAGQKLRIRPDWEQVKVDIMEACLRAKFSKGSALARHLLSTGDQELVEGNTWGDTYWGVCKGEGQNQLGRLLMERRAVLRGAKENIY